MPESLPQPFWPTGGEVVFLCDTTNPLERSLVQNFVQQFTDPDAVEAPRFVHAPTDNYGAPDDPALAEALSAPDGTRLVPLRVAWLPDRDTDQSRPRLRDLVLGDPRKPRIRVARYIQRQRPDRARCVAGKSATVGELRARYEKQLLADAHLEDAVPGESAEEERETFASFVLRQSGLALDVGERKLQGRRYKVPRLVIPGIESSARYRHATRELATESGQTLAEVRAEAHRHLSELVAAPSTFFIDWVGTLTGWITSLGYQEVVTDPENIRRAREIMRDHPSALMWTHKSHVDAIALMSVMYDHDFPTTHSIAGRNMAFKGVGFAGRRSGTVFIRRSFNDKPVYKLALQQYLGYLMEKRFPLSWAFEGTRSRNGKLGPPRYGMLKYVIEAAHATETQNLHLIPVSINYDLIGETPDHVREEAGQAKEAESLGWFLDYLGRLRKPMGNIYLDFADPVVLEGRAPEPTTETLPAIAFEVARKVNEQVPVTLPSLLCLTLLGAAPRSMSYSELESRVTDLIDWLQARDIRLTRALASRDFNELDPLLAQVFESDVVHKTGKGADSQFSVSDDKAGDASYYRNTIVHYFVNQAIGEVALVSASEVEPAQRAARFEEEARWLREVTKFEFFHTPSAEFLPAVEDELSHSYPEWRSALTGSKQDVLDVVARMRPLVAHSALLSILEAYWVVARVAVESDSTEKLKRSDVTATALRRGGTALRAGDVTNRAAIGKAMFQGAHSLLRDQALHALGEGVAEARVELADHLDQTLRRIRLIAELGNR